MESLNLLPLPNFSNKQTLAKAHRALDLAADIYLSSHGRKHIQASELQVLLGPKHTGSGQFFHSLFNQGGRYKVGKCPYWYQVRPQNLSVLLRATRMGPLEWNDFLAAAAIRRGFDFGVRPLSRIEYATVTGDRCYDWWVNLKTDIRTMLFLHEHGAGFDIDIEAAKPTLALQAFDRWKIEQNFNSTVLGMLEFPTWRRMIQDRRAFRSELAAELDLEVHQAKDICQRLLNATMLNDFSGLKSDYGSSFRRIEQNRTCRSLEYEFRIYMNYTRASSRRCGSNGQIASMEYFKIENEVMNSIEEFVQAPCWFIHDGFITPQRLDTNSIELHVLSRTGYSIHLDQSELHEPDLLSPL